MIAGLRARVIEFARQALIRLPGGNHAARRQKIDRLLKGAQTGAKGLLVVMVVLTFLFLVLAACLACAIATAGFIHYWTVSGAPESDTIQLNLNTAPMLTETWRWSTIPSAPEQLLSHAQGGKRQQRGDGSPGTGSSSERSVAVHGHGAEDAAVPLAALLQRRAVTHLLATAHVPLLPRHEWGGRHTVNENERRDDDFLFTPHRFSFGGAASYGISLRLVVPATASNLDLGPMTATLTVLGDSGDFSQSDEAEKESADVPHHRKWHTIVEGHTTASVTSQPWYVRFIREALLLPWTVLSLASANEETVHFPLLVEFSPPESIQRRIRALNVTIHASIPKEDPHLEVRQAFFDVDVTTSGLTYMFRHHPVVTHVILVGFIFTVNATVTLAVIFAGVAYFLATMQPSAGSSAAGNGFAGRTRPSRRRSNQRVEKLKHVRFTDVVDAESSQRSGTPTSSPSSPSTSRGTTPTDGEESRSPATGPSTASPSSGLRRRRPISHRPVLPQDDLDWPHAASDSGTGSSGAPTSAARAAGSPSGGNARTSSPTTLAVGDIPSVASDSE